MLKTPSLTKVENGTITAPAGCGKTHLVAEVIATHPTDELPLLVLTHTNAGVAALRKRVGKFGASAKHARISTLDGWCLRLLSAFPTRGEIDVAHLKLERPSVDYPAIRTGVLNIIQSGHINQIIEATYSRLIVDEYQDCQTEQHQMVVGLSKILPTCVLGDPLQSIFNFGGQQTVDWDKDVLTVFPDSGTLTTPWRWKLVENEELGKWLISIRKNLLNGQQIDLRSAPKCVEWVELTGTDDWEKQLKAANTAPSSPDGGSLIMAKWPREQAEYARRIPGASKVENADLSELLKFASEFSLDADRPLVHLINFASSVMTGIEKTRLRDRLNSIKKNTNRTPPSRVEIAILGFIDAPSYEKSAIILSELSRERGTQVFRQELLRTAIKSLNSAHASDAAALVDLATSIRDQMRFSGRHLPRKAVGSTLLFKGLEADVSIILKAEEMNHRDLYVALTRGAQKLVVCSSSPLLPNQ